MKTCPAQSLGQCDLIDLLPDVVQLVPGSPIADAVAIAVGEEGERTATEDDHLLAAKRSWPGLTTRATRSMTS